MHLPELSLGVRGHGGLMQKHGARMNFQRSILRLATDTVPGAATAAEAVGFRASSIAALSLLATVGL